MTTEILTFMTQDGQRSQAIAAYSLLIGQPIYAIVDQMSNQIAKEQDIDINDATNAIIFADKIYEKIKEIR